MYHHQAMLEIGNNLYTISCLATHLVMSRYFHVLIIDLGGEVDLWLSTAY